MTRRDEFAAGAAAPGRLPLKALLLLLLCAVPLGAGAAAGPALSVVGVEPLAGGTILEDHQDALPHWVERGLAGVVLLHVDADAGLRNVTPERLEALRGLSSRRDLSGLSRAGRDGVARLFDAGNLLRVAAGLGIAREAVWIAPFPHEGGEVARKRLEKYLRRAGLSAREYESFRPEDGCLRGRAGGIPVRVCSQERLPVIGDPVVLSVDAGYFTGAADARDVTFPTEIRLFVNALRAARYAVLDAVIAYSGQEGELPPELRWVGDMAVQALQDPSVVLADKPPERWTALQQLHTLAMGGPEQEREMMGFALAQLEKQPHDPAFLLYAAESSALHGGVERVLAYAEEACRMDRGYCVGLREVGLQFLERGDVERSRALFADAERLLPGMVYGRLDLGIALMRAGKTAEALEALEAERVNNGAFPSGFLIGATHLSQGNRAMARAAFDEGLAAFEQLSDPPVARQEIRQVMAAAAVFYREEGLERQARRLESDLGRSDPAPQPEKTGD